MSRRTTPRRGHRTSIREVSRQVAVLGLCTATGLLAGCSSSDHTTPAPSDSRPPAQQLASQPLPSWIPSPTTGRKATGSVQRPALSYQGVEVRVDLDRGNSVTMNVHGPTAPAGTKVGAEAADLTWTVTVSDATGTVPLSVRQFNVQDEAGKYHWVQPVKGSPMPAKISKDQKVTFKIHTVASAGEGMVRWAPDGKHVVALWDYIAELD